jgi:hypothetical protein
MQDQFITVEEVRDSLNALEAIETRLSGEDDFLAAMVRNQRVIAQAVLANGTVGIGDVPPHTAGLAVDDAKSGSSIDVLFQLDGRTVVESFRSENSVSKGETLVVAEDGESVRPVVEVDESKLTIGSTSRAFIQSSDYYVKETNGTVEAEPGEEVEVLSIEPNSKRGIHAIGTVDREDTEYIYKVDGSSLLDEPMPSPLGLYNNMHEFPQPLSFNEAFKVKARLDDDAPGPREYFSKAEYLG